MRHTFSALGRCLAVLTLCKVECGQEPFSALHCRHGGDQSYCFWPPLSPNRLDTEYLKVPRYCWLISMSRIGHSKFASESQIYDQLMRLKLS